MPFLSDRTMEPQRLSRHRFVIRPGGDIGRGPDDAIYMMVGEENVRIIRFLIEDESNRIVLFESGGRYEWRGDDWWDDDPSFPEVHAKFLTILRIALSQDRSKIDRMAAIVHPNDILERMRFIASIPE